MRSEVAVLVIGKSGTGKSEFILSMIDEEHRERIPASGRGQTTRCNMEYVIDYSDAESELKLEVRLKKKDEFCEERMQAVEQYFSDTQNNDLEDFMVDRYLEACFEHLKQNMIYDDAFFNCSEFGEEAEKKIADLFESEFSNKEFWKEISRNPYTVCEDEKVTEDHVLVKKFEEFWKNVYDICREYVTERKEKFVLTKETPCDMIERYLKVKEDGVSYSSLVKKISIFAKGYRGYQSDMEKYKIKKVRLIDTYGLDHAEQINSFALKKRYENLLRKNEETPEIDAVFYLRNIAAPGSPSDLQLGISTLFQVEPSVIPYVIFTFLDEVFDESSPNAFMSTKACREVEKTRYTIRKTLVKEGVSESLIKNRIAALLDTRIGYASKGAEKKAGVCENNRKSIEKVFSAIRLKKHLGTAYIPIKLMKEDKVKTALSTEGLFKSRELNKYPSGTKGAIRKRIQGKTETGKGRELGFDSSTRESVLWTYIIATDLNKRFTNITGEWNETNDTSDEVSQAVQEIFIDFAHSLYFGATNYVEDLDSSKIYGNLIIKALYEDRKSCIEEDFWNVGNYLTKIYDFEGLDRDTKEKIQRIIYEAYDRIFIRKCREHNARKIAEQITEHTTYREKEQLISKYYDECESEMEEEEKIEFEQLISDNITV